MPKNKQKSKAARNFPSNFTVTPIKPPVSSEPKKEGESLSASQDRSVLRKENIWRAIAQWSAIAFFLAAGVALLGYYYWGGESNLGPRAWLAGRDKIALPAQSTIEGGPTPINEELLLRAVDGQPLPEGGGSGIYYAVMIDNHPDARPLSGLASASLVYEAPAEGGITRFMAIYPADDLVKRIGPVRSSRSYHLDWAAEFDSLYAHVGGSPESLNLIKQSELRDLNEFWNGKYFWRDLSRRSPHKIFTSTGLLHNAFEDKFGDEEIVLAEAWRFKEDLRMEDRPLETDDVVIDWSSPVHKVAWCYDNEGNFYRRLQASQEQRDEDNSPVRVKNVILQFSAIKVIDQIGRRQIKTIGEGRAVILNDGQITEAIWNKASATSRTRYLTPDGDEVFFNVGKTWVEIIPQSMEVSGLGDSISEDYCFYEYERKWLE